MKRLNSADTEALAREFNTVAAQGDAKAVEFVQRLTEQGQQATVSATEGALSLVANRVSSTVGAGSGAFADSAAGVAAGDSAERFGAWADVSMGTSTQKLRKGTPGFKSNSYTGVVGADTMLNDASSLGVMLGYANNNMKHKDVKAGDKTKAGTMLFGAYGTYSFANNAFVQANFAVAQTKVKAKSGRVTAGAKVTAAGDYDLMGYTAEVRGGYKFKFDNSHITPTAGLRYNLLLVIHLIQKQVLVHRT
ncbi:MAG UNVERIFIED_CONTAM: autotransporter outer membrane beta-barrel domain-containing protein [Rickettsiaceae bacterium]